MKTRWWIAAAAAAALAAFAGAATVHSQGAPPAPTTPLVHRTNVRAVYQVHGDRWKEGVGQGLHTMHKLHGAYDKLGVPMRERHLVVVVHGAAGYWLLNDRAWKAYQGPRDNRAPSNPNATMVAELIRNGVSVELCANTMQERGWKPEDLLGGVRVVPGAYPRVIDLQLQGYAHLLFD